MSLDEKSSDQFVSEKKNTGIIDELQMKVKEISRKVQERETLVKDLEVSVNFQKIVKFVTKLILG